MMINNKQQSIFSLTTLFNFGYFKPFFKTVILFLITAIYFSQVVHADTGVTITSAKSDEEIKTYSGPSSSEKTGNTIGSSEVENKPVIKDAMNGRFLNIKLDGGNEVWIKAKKVITTQVYDVGACETQNKSSGTRAAVNCTE